MPVVPSENRQHVFHTARDRLEGHDDYPDVRSSGRWIKIQTDPSVPREVLEELSQELRSEGYHTSIVRSTVKATKDDVEWPVVPEND
jgi:hypothetical protein